MTENDKILVASSDRMFVDVVGQMVVEAGYTPSPCAPGEPPWLAMTRIEPRLVICDCVSTGDPVRRLAVEANARGLPMLLFRPGRSPSRAADPGVRSLTLPVSRELFVATLRELLAPSALEVLTRGAGDPPPLPLEGERGTLPQGGHRGEIE